jgi:hypothetical protein
MQHHIWYGLLAWSTSCSYCVYVKRAAAILEPTDMCGLQGQNVQGGKLHLQRACDYNNEECKSVTDTVIIIRQKFDCIIEGILYVPLVRSCALNSSMSILQPA